MVALQSNSDFQRRGRAGVDGLDSFKAGNVAILLSKVIQHKFVARLFIGCAWLAFAFIVFATLAPLQFRPVVSHHAQLERFAAFATLGLLFGLAYPQRLMADWFFLIAAAGLLEASQHLTGDRHGHLRDATAKALGGTFGVAVALLILATLSYCRPRLMSRQPVKR
jgi:hypothetical protein